ncbi:hypothetical protein [Streptomyces sp. NBC_00019]|uniref:hypothetical protein n=1 Tax=Streptomyces sp. NBC_00019 TaxID=2975623 RepID=UPI00324ECC9A
MPATTRREACAMAAILALVLTSSCDSGGDGGKGAPQTSRPAATASSSPTEAGTSPSVSESAVPTDTAPEDREQAEQGIRDAWQVFFAPDSSLTERSEVVESGDENALMIDNLFRDPLGSKLRADVTSVSYTSDLNADVAYTLTRDGRRLDTRGPGAAVLQDDAWKIALRTVCDLTRHAKDAPEAPSCDEPSALPR